MKLDLFGRKPRSKQAVSSVVGGIIIFAMLFTVAFGYFYSITQDQQVYLSVGKNAGISTAQKYQESLYIIGSLSNGQLAFSVNNTGISTTLVSEFVIDQTGNVVFFKNASSSSATACSTTSAAIPCALNQGASAYFITNIVYAAGTSYVFKVLTSRGTLTLGGYPNQQLTSTSVNALVASGLGSLQMIFNSFSVYDYSQTGGPWKVNLTSGQTAAISPYNKDVVLSAEVTNDDPSVGTIVVDAHTDLWTFVSCSGGCGSQSLLFFYIMNMASDGTITSTTQGSYTPIQIPFGTTKTLYFGSSNDLSLGSYGSQSISDSISEHDVFMIFSGTLVTAKNSTIYSQNLPFAATFTSDNVAYHSESPTTCAKGQSASFSLTVSNSKWSVTGATQGIKKVWVNAGSFSSVLGFAAAGWTVNSYANGTIIWTASSSANYIHAPGSKTFTWSGTAPSVASGTQYIFPSTVYFNSGTILSQPIDSGCFVS